MSKVLILGYFKNNFGDDLFIYTLARNLPNKSFILIAPASYRKFGKEKNILWINSNFFLFALLSKILNVFVILGRKLKLTNRINFTREQLIADILSPIIKETVYISGSIFMESDNGYDTFAKSQLDKWLYARKPYVLGINFGPYRTDDFLKSSIQLLNNAKLVTFRDKYSYNLLNGKLKTKSLYSPDLAFAYCRGGGCKLSTENGYYFISVLNLDSVSANSETVKAYENLIVSFVDEITAKGERVVLCGFCQTLKDNIAVARVIDRASDKNLCKAINYPESTFDEVLWEIANAKGVVATRHHAMILALKYQRPMFAISYNQKMEYTLQDLKIPKNAYASLEDIKNLTPKIILDSMYKAQIEDVQLWETRSKKIFKTLESKIDADKK